MAPITEKTVVIQCCPALSIFQAIKSLDLSILSRNLALIHEISRLFLLEIERSAEENLIVFSSPAPSFRAVCQHSICQSPSIPERGGALPYPFPPFFPHGQEKLSEEGEKTNKSNFRRTREDFLLLTADYGGRELQMLFLPRRTRRGWRRRRWGRRWRGMLL